MATAEASTAQATAIPTGIWEIDPVHSSIGFGVRHLGISTFRGEFSGFSGRIETADGVISSVAGTIDTTSLDVRDKTLAGHLRSPDFFDIENHPEARYESTAVEPTGDGFRLLGDLTIRDISKPVELDVKVDGVGVGPQGEERISLVAQGAVDRSDYGMTWDAELENGQSALGNEVQLTLAVEAIKAA